MNEQQKIMLHPVEVAAFSLNAASDILKRQSPTALPQWQFHGGPLVVGNEIKQVMVKVDQIKSPDILVPTGGPILMPR
jgi:hypothetical protein